LGGDVDEVLLDHVVRQFVRDVLRLFFNAVRLE
jgi:hypothetical protein